MDSANLDSLNSYRKGWKALNRLLHENKSFSGRETNNAFLNCADGGRFADISTAIGWDFADDARAIGLVDWDQDGDLDVWVTNRTAPRVRLLRNNLKSESGFVSLHLTGNGKTTNRDAIGSRVEVFLKGNPIPQMRTLHAGQSFLSQSSRWLHFGLGLESSIEKVVVFWPGTEAETFTGVAQNNFFHLVQGSGKATPREKPQEIKWSPGEAGLPPHTSVARTIPPSGHTLPPLQTQSGGFVKPTGTTLISLWSRTCPHCQAELTGWGQELKQWHDSGIKVIAFSTDQEPRAQCDAYLKSVGIDFTAEMASPDAVEILDAIQASLVDLWSPIPIPSSFLATGEGEILAVYRGPVSREQVIKDAALADATPEARRASATPFQGRWVGEPAEGNPKRATDQLVQRARPLTAIQYLQSALTKSFVKGTKFDRADNLLLLGQLLGQQARPAEAVPPLREAYQILPHDIRILRLLVTGLKEISQFEEAVVVMKAGLAQYPDNPELLQDAINLALTMKDHPQALAYAQQAVQLVPNDPRVNFSLVQILLLNGQAREAIEACKKSLGTHPQFFAAANQLSRILSTHPDEKIRSPEESFALANRLCQITQNKDGGHLLALALAQANLGKFQEATQLLETLQKALPADSEIGREINAALESTRKMKPIRNLSWEPMDK